MTLIDKQKNKVLKALYNLHNNIFNADDVPSSLRLLSQDTGIVEHRLKDICGLLEEEDLVQIIRIGEKMYTRIKPKGVEKVEKG
ncbi:hypothetical protein ES703_03135 [subsurface metagenome]